MGSRNFGYAQVEARGRSGGLLLVWDTNSFSTRQLVGEERFIAVKGNWKRMEGDVVLANVYGPHLANQKGEISKGCIATFITLIPKVTDPVGLDDFRLIRLIGVYYKIIAKICEKSKAKWWEVIPVRYGRLYRIEGKWLSYKDYEISFSVNFEGLNAMVNEVVTKGIFKGVQIGTSDVTISHLQYADDTIFFGEWCRYNTINLMYVLKGFEKVSRLKINLNKSRVYGLGVDQCAVERMARRMACSVGELPLTYLGLPIGVCMRREGAWRSVIEKFKKRLADCNAKAISFGGRLTLVKSVLGSLPLGDKGNGENLEDFWGLGLARESRGRLVRELETLEQTMSNNNITLNGRDTWKWVLDDSDVFLVKALSDLVEVKCHQYWEIRLRDDVE
ncbi:hypothetical protein Tco_0927743 [Tanacetum coccineum]